MKVLIVEDDFVIAESLGNELSHWNYEVSIAKQFDNILEEFKTAEPELCLLYTSPSPRDQRGSRMPSSA